MTSYYFCSLAGDALRDVVADLQGGPGRPFTLAVNQVLGHGLLDPRRLGAEPQAVVAVEDSGAGARSARAAGLYVVGYAPEGNAFVGADRSILTLTEVVALFEA